MRRFKKIYLGKDNDRILSFINEHGGTVFHEPYFNQLIQKYFSTDFYYLVESVDEFGIIAPIHSKKKIINNQLSFKALGDVPYGGFIGNEKVFEKDLKPGLFQKVEYAGMPIIKGGLHSFQKFGETCMVDLGLFEDDIFNNIINSKRRNMIRKALKNDVSIVKYKSLEGFNLYKPLLEGLHERLGYKHLNIDFYRELFLFYSALGQSIILLAYIDGKLCSGNLLLGNKNIIHYYKGASIANVKNMGQGELLQWEGIKWAKKNNSSYYDLCNLNKKKLPSLYKFKTGISSEIFQYPVYNNSSLSYKIFNRLLVNDK